jgi:hypothetical protein
MTNVAVLDNWQGYGSNQLGLIAAIGGTKVEFFA